MQKTLIIKAMAIATLLISQISLRAQSVTWASNIAPILYNNCTNCHINGGIGPFSLVGYTKAKAYASSIAAATENKTMPPWPADPKYRRYAHERILSTEEIEQIKTWAKDGAPEGDASKAPEDPKPKSGNTILNATLSLKMPTYTVNTTADEYRCFVLPTQFTADNYLTAIEVVPGNPKVVHHVLVFHDTSAIPAKNDAKDPQPGYLSFGGTGSPTSQLIGVYVPGQEPYIFPDGLGAKLLKKGNIILQIHYPGYVQNQIDSTKVLLQTTTQTIRNMLIVPAVNHNSPTLINGPLYIPADQKKTFNTKTTLNNPITIFAVAPHMHLVGKSIKAFSINGKDTTPIVNIPNWDFHWQRTYVMRRPLILSKGTEIWGEANYDNTAQNPNNPNSPPIAVELGEGTKDEMMLVYFWLSGYNPGDEGMVIDGSALKNISSVKLFQSNRISIYPNPSNNRIQLQSQNPCEFYELFDQQGRLVKSGIPELNNDLKSIGIDLKDINMGCFQLVTHFADGSKSSNRLIKN